MIKSSINARKSDRRTLIKQGWQHPYVEKHGNKSMEWKNGQSEIKKRERMCKKSRKNNHETYKANKVRSHFQNQVDRTISSWICGKNQKST